MKVMRKIIEIDEEKCDGCGQCVPGCAEGSLQIIDGKARLVEDKLCDGLGACLGECPTGALKIVEREAEEFDEEAVEAYLEQKAKEEKDKPSTMACGCPSSQIQVLKPYEPKTDAGSGEKAGDISSELTHWPVQIRLIPPDAPFLKGADLLILADCSAVSIPNLHRDFLKGKVVMMGCPKFDDADNYVERFAEIFKTAGIQSITTVFMEVPCCSALPSIVKKGLSEAGVSIPMTEVVITRKGEIES